MEYKTLTIKTDVVSVDIPTMAAMPLKEYEDYIRTGLAFVDHHDVLRSTPAGYPLAATKAQVRALIRYLEELAARIGNETQDER